MSPSRRGVIAVGALTESDKSVVGTSVDPGDGSFTESDHGTFVGEVIGASVGASVGEDVSVFVGASVGATVD